MFSFDLKDVLSERKVWVKAELVLSNRLQSRLLKALNNKGQWRRKLVIDSIP